MRAPRYSTDSDEYEEYTDASPPRHPQPVQIQTRAPRFPVDETSDLDDVSSGDHLRPLHLGRITESPTPAGDLVQGRIPRSPKQVEWALDEASDHDLVLPLSSSLDDSGISDSARTTRRQGPNKSLIQDGQRILSPHATAESPSEVDVVPNAGPASGAREPPVKDPAPEGR